MKALIGMVSLLVALAISGLLVMKQLKSTGQGLGTAASAPAAALNGSPAEQSRQLQEKVRGDVVKALEQGGSRNEAEQ